MANGTSPLDAALDGIERDGLKGGAPPPPPPVVEGEDGSSPPSPPPDSPPKRRGRPISPNSRRARAGAYIGGVSGPVKGPPVPPDARVEFAKISPDAVAASIKQIDAIIVKMAGTAPLTPEEAKGGGEVFAPVLDHYMPLLADKGGMWVGPVTWVVLAYGPRVYELLDQRQRDIDAKRRGIPVIATEEARPGDDRVGTFSREGQGTNNRPFSASGN